MKKPIFYGAVHLLFYRNDQVLLLKRQNTGFEDGKWSVVAGRIDGGEEVKTAAIREAKEEAGIDIAPDDIELVGVFHRKNKDSEWIDFYLRVHRWTGTIINAEPYKCEELKWFPMHELPDNVISYVRKAVEKNHNQMWFESVGWQENQ
ncbi:NUDIX domain-containing protein [Cohnella sp. CFH 77786]|uniref:NUDIX hydrolase n=1 Tax=Cohnella sp. CFH 77786 TaxID=2662265 RepID=UPI001C6096E4|nr:NUDIX domain-containing protein [Cohnella sp. CFH 77786]MBW5448085.1 NUDIX domain-containing protein [Cohnella sp. CFH 77786]